MFSTAIPALTSGYPRVEKAAPRLMTMNGLLKGAHISAIHAGDEQP
ncbi:hypothetical protein FHS38_001444 [Streptomyces netropsis]|uniref:Uncharacterized protein n=1 Tax=Streptomyces netropsis TaxID=55404 RepID=A0A7W7L982_STRNE|nr:hypothetical protein [Streptomyces netropsis]